MIHPFFSDSEDSLGPYRALGTYLRKYVSVILGLLKKELELIGCESRLLFLFCFKKTGTTKDDRLEWKENAYPRASQSCELFRSELMSSCLVLLPSEGSMDASNTKRQRNHGKYGVCRRGTHSFPSLCMPASH